MSDGGAPVDPVGEAYRRVGRVHYALAEASRVDADLQRWCLDELMAALHRLEQVRRGEG